jgi:cell division transport system ATP-binding protein
MSIPVVELTNVSAGYGERQVLRSLHLVVNKGELVVIEGATGTGKTTLMSVLLGSLPAFVGFGKVAGVTLNGASRIELATLRRRIGMIFQRARFLAPDSVLYNVSLPLAIQGEPTTRCRAEATRALLDAGLLSSAQKKPHELSGGEQARLQIARALIHRPLIVLADEPFAHLDPEAAAETEDLLAAAHTRGATILITTHRPTRLAERARRLKLEDGVLR